jgi:hypothetical protein
MREVDFVDIGIDGHSEPFPASLAVFCFSDGETIRAQGGKADVVEQTKPPDKVGVRQPETQPLVCFANQQAFNYAGRIIRISRQMRFDQWDGACCTNISAKPLARTKSAGLRLFA